MLEGTDSVTGETFHRLIGGGIEFGETAEAALRREFAEELGVTLGSVELLEVVENIFEPHLPGRSLPHCQRSGSVGESVAGTRVAAKAAPQQFSVKRDSSD